MIRAEVGRTCRGCEHVQDEPWAGERKVAHRCMAPGDCQGRVVGFDQAWNNLIPAWCGKRPDGGGLREPERYESRGEIHPGAMDAPKAAAMAAANVRWKQLREQLESEMKQR